VTRKKRKKAKKKKKKIWKGWGVESFYVEPWGGAGTAKGKKKGGKRPGPGKCGGNFHPQRGRTKNVTPPFAGTP